MKKILFILACMGLTLQQGQDYLAEQQGVTTSPTQQAQSLSAQVAQQEPVDPWYPMESPINALVMCMLERGYDYDPADPEFYWASLYYMVGIYHSGDWRVKDSGEAIIVPQEMLWDSAYALFATTTQPPALPASIQPFIQAQEADRSYILAKGDPGQAEAVHLSTQYLGEGVYQISGEYRSQSNQSLLCDFSAFVVADSNMYGYYVQDIIVQPAQPLEGDMVAYG